MHFLRTKSKLKNDVTGPHHHREDGTLMRRNKYFLIGPSKRPGKNFGPIYSRVRVVLAHTYIHT